MDTFKALMVDLKENTVQATIRETPCDALPPGDVLVAVAYSSLNYKDGLAITGKGKIVRSYPMVPGIDLAGTVVESQSPDFQPGDRVLLTGWGVGERHWGGYAQMARVQAGWLLPLPAGLTMAQAMGIGSAGFTAMQCVMALEEHGVMPSGGEVVVTGATGGVGSFAVAILANLGYSVVAVTGRPQFHDYLRALGASGFLGREELASPRKPLESERWAGAVDVVGGAVLSGLLPSMAYGSSVAMCGLAGGSDLVTTVFPFILRGVNLLGIDSVRCPPPRRRLVWERIGRDVSLEKLDAVVQVEPLERLLTLGDEIVQGRVRGRVVIDVNG
ncbi:MAG: oxidoreductase [Chloroflexaceae bacterium]|nr:oxidoreductase [Chloroflexaceae bacterium]